MPRKYELTWQPGSKGRSGRWRKKYRGKVLYFDGGKGKTDRESYQNAFFEWKRLRTRIDEQLPKPHQAEYARTILEWECVFVWSKQNDDDQYIGLAQRKIEELRRRLSGPRPSPLTDDDKFWSRFEPRVLPGLSELLASILPAPPTDLDSPLVVDPSKLSHGMDDNKQRIGKAIWQDRLEVFRRHQEDQPDTVGANIDTFLDIKQKRVKAGKLSAPRYSNLRLFLGYFQDHVGRQTPVSAISGKTLVSYHSELLGKVSRGEIADAYARYQMESIKSFIRWCWQVEAIDTLPRNIDSKDLNFTRSLSKVEIYTKEEISTLLTGATDRMKLYILLMLNCGMTQKDISDLQKSEVDLEIGLITRKRSKTAKHENVPTVTYRLWKETLRLLRQEVAPKGDRALIHEDGGLLKVEKLQENGKVQISDRIQVQFRRLRLKLKVGGTLKWFKKTSATLLRNNPRYASIEDLFLDHAPRTLSDRHYTQVPQELLDEAIEWLEEQFSIE